MIITKAYMTFKCRQLKLVINKHRYYFMHLKVKNPKFFKDRNNIKYTHYNGFVHLYKMLISLLKL